MFVDKNWQEVPLFVLGDDVMIECEEHGEFCPNAYYGTDEISRMIQDGHIDCPLCLAEICGR